MRGVTLVELILALVVFSLLSLAVLTLLPSSMLAVKKADVHLRADALAESLLEHYRVQPFGTLAGETLPYEEPFSRRLDVTPRGSRLKELKVTVSWEDGRRSVVHSVLVVNLPR